MIELSNGDKINLELYPDLAPITVANFVSLAEEGKYDGTIFHRVIEGFMIQGGGYDLGFDAVDADNIIGEFSSNGYDNDLSHTRGVISMARAQDYDSASSQFFIMHQDALYLDGEYAAFGRVSDDESLAVVDKIAAVSTGVIEELGLSDVPVSPVLITTITIE
ncbi:MAG: peptidylprolyl isomerase [Firmicutes bacterium]|nr:peptidylprolyl isomerase [Bacillota bacterium]